MSFDTTPGDIIQAAGLLYSAQTQKGGARKGWSVKEEAQLIELRNAGVITGVIGIILGRTRKSIRKHIEFLGLAPAPKRGRPKGSKTRRPRVLPPKPILATEPIAPRKAWDDEAKDRKLRTMWKKPWSNYVIAERIGKTAPQVAQRGQELNLGPRPRADGTRKCVKCQEPFVPDDWKLDWYCEKHKKFAAQTSADLTMPSNPSGRVLPKCAHG